MATLRSVWGRHAPAGRRRPGASGRSGGAPRLRGPRALAAAVEAVLCDGHDLVVVDDLVRPATARQLQEGGMDPRQVLYDAVPTIDLVDQFVGAWWEHEGYRDYEIAGPGWCAGEVKAGGIVAHCDEDQFVDGEVTPHLIFAPISMSIGLTEHRARFEAERMDVDWFRADRTYQPDGQRRFLLSDHPVVRRARPPRSTVVQGRGGAVLFATHPRPAVHATVAPPARRAQLFEYCAVRRSTVADAAPSEAGPPHPVPGP